ncbi:hypothetical protein RXV86_01430 [Alisedimentitalea sp. MJ-SS2]|uniref:hypothetical protein n=1 Tax=Aliisedimentitalea sp. MJ-SS2 TaxID=3049795 RepID=UPI0029082AA7|nr:hypothetical protein [Alisedimentitalea sp. MJ-SS2]MDU8926037.1 hypothetical protein [Alisedimentitalea sp. MJ-SS2]
MLRVFLLILGLIPVGAIAQERLSADAFDRLTQGKTYYYSSGGRPYGAEEYLENRRVRWSFLDGQCMDGRWWEDGDQICFVYEDHPDDPHCWSFRHGPGGLEAQFENDPTGRQLYEVETSNEPLHCLGPKIGA